MTSPSFAIDRTEAELELDLVLNSPVFQNAGRSKRFLRYLVDSSLAQPPIAVKEFTIAIDVFDRDTSYDPSIDATVRVEASRLRTRLREYYAEHGREDPLLIDVPKGAYAAVFSRRPSAEANAPLSAEANHPPAATAPLASNPRFGLRHLGVASLLGCLVLVVAALAAWTWHRSRTPRLPSAATASLAILPIANQTGDPTLGYLSDGLTDDLIRQLSQVPALKLIARSSVFRYQQSAADPRAIGRSLHVGDVMTGELRRSADHLSLTAEVTNVTDGSVLLDREYIVEGTDLRAVQGDLQRDLLARLHVETSARDPGRKLHSVTSSPLAYQEFLAGDSLTRAGGPAEMHQAIPHFQRAVALDPDFDLAWSALASAHVFLALYFEPPRDHMPLARTFARRALQINPALGEAHGTLGLVHLVYDWNIPAAEAEMSTAGAQQAAVSTLACTAHLIERTGQPRTAEEMLGRMLTYDPQSAALIAELGCVDYYRGHYDAALRHYRDALQADPHSPVPYWGLGKTLNAQGKHDEAIAALQSFKKRNGFEPPLLTAEIGYALGAAGRKQEAHAIIRNLTSRPPKSFVDPYLISVIYASMNDRPATFNWLQRACNARSTFMISLLTEPKWDTFRADPRFAQLLQKMSNPNPT